MLDVVFIKRDSFLQIIYIDKSSEIAYFSNLLITLSTSHITKDILSLKLKDTKLKIY